MLNNPRGNPRGPHPSITVPPPFVPPMRGSFHGIGMPGRYHEPMWDGTDEYVNPVPPPRPSLGPAAAAGHSPVGTPPPHSHHSPHSPLPTSSRRLAPHTPIIHTHRKPHRSNQPPSPGEIVDDDEDEEGLVRDDDDDDDEAGMLSPGGHSSLGGHYYPEPPMPQRRLPIGLEDGRLLSSSEEAPVMTRTMRKRTEDESAPIAKRLRKV